VRLDEIFQQFNQQVQFINIYIREAHPIDGWWFGTRLTKKMISKVFPNVSMSHYDPKTIEERRAVAGECKSALNYGIRTYVDKIDDHVNIAYAAWPNQLYLIGLDGKVAYAGGLGPAGMKPNQLKSAISDYLAGE
jgi:hypothetical protein